MQDGDWVRVKTGFYMGLEGELVGEPSMQGVAIKSSRTGMIISVRYPPGIWTNTIDQLLELVPPGDATSGIPQPA